MNIFIILVLFFNILFGRGTNSSYCIVNIDSSGITVSNFTEKDDFKTYTSNFIYNTTSIKFQENENWTFSNCSELIIDPILDKRWENFKNNVEDTRTEALFNEFNSLLLNKSNRSCNIFLSIYKLNNEIDYLERHKWNHLRINGSDNSTYRYDEFEPLQINETFNDMLNKTEIVWKLQNAKFLHTINYSFNYMEIYSAPANCSTLISPRTCIYFYVAMCENCTLTMGLIDQNQAQASYYNRSLTSTTPGKWKWEEFCIENLTDCFNISIKTNNATNGFWAISDEGYVTKYPYSYCESSNNKRFIEIEDYECATSHNEKIEERINESTNLHKEECVNKETTTDSATDTTSVNSYFSKEDLIAPRTKTVNNPEDEPEKASFNLWLVISLVIGVTVFVLVLVATIIFCKKKNLKGSAIYRTVDTNDNNLELPRMPTAEWPPIERQMFSEYVRKAFDLNGNSRYLLKNQFDNLPTGYSKEAHEGIRQANRSKNRYDRIIPYDENRVKLTRNLDDITDGTDYINASYVHGFNETKEYIATQNPLVNTAADFWRMIWQENVNDIIMITDANEKYYKYWPDIDMIVNYSGIQINLKQINTFEFYEHHVFELRRYGKCREVNHFHYNFWPMEDEIISPHTFVQFLNTILTIPHYSNSPVVIHSTSGTGRTGVIVLCDIALRSATVQGKVNLFGIARDLRLCRINMIRNLKQYELAHLIVMEAFNFKETAVEINSEFEIYFDKLFESNDINEKWHQHLENTEWIHEAITPYEKSTKYSNQNRYKDLLPVEQNRVVLQYRDPNYIHAMYVSGYRNEERYIVAQQPLPCTLSNFWIMILQNKINTIINLNEIDSTNANYCLYFPTEDFQILKLELRLEIRFVSIKSFQNYDRLVVNVFEGHKLTSTVLVIALKNWFKTMNVPESSNDVVDICREVTETENKSQIVICCDDGIKASGLVACCMYMIGKMFREKKCDVINAVRAIRRTHTDFINVEQFIFLHHCAKEICKRYFQK